MQFIDFYSYVFDVYFLLFKKKIKPLKATTVCFRKAE